MVGLRSPDRELFTGPWRNLENNCTVVFASFVTEPASECVCVWGGGGGGRGGVVTLPPPPPPPLTSSVTIHEKTTVHCSPDSQSRNWDSPNPSPAGGCAPPFGSGGERGGGRVPIPTRGHTLWYSVNISTLCPDWRALKVLIKRKSLINTIYFICYTSPYIS